ncbi:ABC transporter permease [Flaviflexus massiliensis]|uniref:ABC transporter permease n=1 Tax=Flaviflexus massiliensis TaxID=1522309 RepID=UPI0009E736BE|nr:ABC transporter permease [Flaviflexus massiliensis]
MSAAIQLEAPKMAEGTRMPISWKMSIIYGLATLLSLYFALNSDGVAEFVWKEIRPSRDGSNLLLYADQTVWALTAVIAIATAYSVYRAVRRQKQPLWLGLIILMALVVAFLTFQGGGSGRFITIAFLFSATITAAQPLIFGSMAGVICERVGVVNIAIEGQLLVGAFTGVVVASATQNPWLGLLAAPLAGALVGVLLAFFSVKYAVDQIIVGVVLNVLCLGLTSFLLGTVVRDTPGWNSIQFSLPVWSVPVLSDIPFIGPVFFQQTIITYLLYAALIALTIMLFRSRWGLRMRAVGEHPKAADTVGIKVNRTRFLNTVLGSSLAGLGGASFTIGATTVFTENISAGNGYIALAAMILGKWHPIGAMGAALMFGFASAIVDFLPLVATTPIDPNLLAMIPYVVTILAVAGFVGKSRPPAAENIPYIKA